MADTLHLLRVARIQIVAPPQQKISWPQSNRIPRIESSVIIYAPYFIDAAKFTHAHTFTSRGSISASLKMLQLMGSSFCSFLKPFPKQLRLQNATVL